MKIAVVSGAGQLGRCTVEGLLAGRCDAGDVVVGVRTPDKAADLAERGVVVRRADYDDPATLASAFAGVDTVHAIPTFASPPQRVQQLENILGAARECGVKRIVNVSLIGTAIDNPFSVMPYLVYAEAAVRVSGLSWTLLRNGYYADPIVDWVPDILKMGTIPYPTGEGGCPYVAREDLGRAAAAVLTSAGHEGKVYELTGPEALTTEELCKAVAQGTGKPVEHRPVSVEEYVRICVEGGEPEPFAWLLATLYTAIERGFTGRASAHIEELTGTAPKRMVDLVRARYGG
jgi:NAD(P)H dehydrogenase (quinone)